MITARTEEHTPLTRSETVKILADTAHAVKVMKASWLHVALNLQKIRQHRLWEQTNPPCRSYEEYTDQVLKLNKYVAHRMLLAMEYTEEHRPQVIRDFQKRGDEADVPSYEVVNQLRRVEESFKDRKGDMDDLHSLVYDGGAGRVVLKREIDTRLGKMETREKNDKSDEKKAPATLQEVIQELMNLEKRLGELKVSKDARKLAFQLIETLQEELKKR